jgi:hypothetical protein
MSTTSSKIVEIDNKDIKHQNSLPIYDVPFWFEDPNILFYSLQFFPAPTATENENLNALSRLVLVLTVFGYMGTGRLSTLLVGLLTLGFLVVYYYILAKKRAKEAFENPSTEAKAIQELLANPPPLHMDKPTPLNPFCNVLPTDVQGRPDKPPAPPVDDPHVQDAIFQAAKQTMIQSHPTLQDIDKRLLTNLGDLFQFEQSLQPFYVNPATTIPEDQQSFAEFCYGSMISCKEGNLFACARNNAASHYNNY